MKRSAAALALALGILAMSARLANAAPTFDKEMACFQAIYTHSTGPGTSLDDDLVLLPRARFGKEGMYLFTVSGAYYHHLPTPPSEKGLTPYYFDVQVPGAKPKRMTYTFVPNDPQHPGIAHGPGLVRPSGKTATPLVHGDALGSEAVGAFIDLLSTRVKSLASGYRDGIEMNKQDPHGPRPDLGTIHSALEVCDKVDNPLLHDAIIREKIKLSRVDPKIEGDDSGPSHDGSKSSRASSHRLKKHH